MLYDNQRFAHLFAHAGKPARAPAPGAGPAPPIHRGPVRPAGRDAGRNRISWQYVLGVSLAEPGFDAVVWSEFRTRLLHADAAAYRTRNMLRYNDITHKERDLVAMTGYTKQEFTALLPAFQQSYDEYLRRNTIEGYERMGRIPKSYHTSPLPTIEDKLLFILVYLKQHPTQTLQGYLFDMSQSNTNKWLHVLPAVLNRALEHLGSLPQREMVIETADAADTEADAAEPPPFSSTTAQNDR
jgi:hypothetical protein